ncbi:hypothetical protein E3T55_11470 [Cryobacterium frigoriphilum]|uniref:Uncharacterized protein n=1 Tax=Cryobacterium frigoriphilum TaxID=1259150 RepID=A0A4R8ZZ74_9MICO|nr:hypothetical protein [Cryobacterium frigoriphilum]TFD49384.1 hypothetical protein E3T55_11470 [Cryobacterium frigoriphilum]
MNGPTDENTTPQTAPVSQPPEHRPVDDDGTRDIRRERQREKRRKWAQEHPDRVRELNRIWRLEHLERARQQNREQMRRAVVRRRQQEEVRARGRERARLWREAHPGRNREYQQRWVEQNRDKIREYYRRYYDHHSAEVNARAIARRDADPERTKQISKEWAERNKERRAEWQRARRSDPDIYQVELAANAAARRFKRQLSHLGLPPKQLHLATAAERRAHDRDADAYFTDPALPEHLRQFTVFAETLTELMLHNGTRMLDFATAYVTDRARMGLPPVSAETIAYGRAVELVMQRMRRVDLLTGRDVAAAVRSTQAEVPRIERQQQFDQLVKGVVARVNRYRVRLGSDAKIENKARAHRGKPQVKAETLMVQIAMKDVSERMSTNRLTADDARGAARIIGLHVSTTLDTRRTTMGASAQGRSLG